MPKNVKTQDKVRRAAGDCAVVRDDSLYARLLRDHTGDWLRKYRRTGYKNEKARVRARLASWALARSEGRETIGNPYSDTKVFEEWYALHGLEDLIQKSFRSIQEMLGVRGATPTLWREAYDKKILPDIEGAGKIISREIGSCLATWSVSDSVIEHYDTRMRRDINELKERWHNKIEIEVEKADARTARSTKQSEEAKSFGDPVATEEQVVFRKEGSAWIIGGMSNEPGPLADLLGLCYYHFALQDPNRRLSVDELYAATAQPQASSLSSRARAAAQRELKSAGLTVISNPGWDVIDPEALHKVRKKLEAINDQIGTYEELQDSEKIAELKEERLELADYLKKGTGHFGKSRKTGSRQENNRTNVQRAMKTALKHIEKVDPQLASYLSERVKTGADILYTPDPSSPIDWQF